MADEAEPPFSVNLVVDLFALLAVVVSQTLFWWFYAGPAAADDPRKRARILQEARQVLRKRHQHFLVQQLDASVRTLHGSSRAGAERDRADADAHNRHQLLVWIVPVLAVLLVLLIACVAYNRRSRHALVAGQWFGLGLVCFGFVPSLVFHATVAHEYGTVGDVRATRLLVGEDVGDHEDA